METILLNILDAWTNIIANKSPSLTNRGLCGEGNTMEMSGPQRTACLAKGYTNNCCTGLLMNKFYILIGTTDFIGIVIGLTQVDC